MNKSISALEPTLIWKHFAKICEIPHISKKEQQIINYVSSLGHSLRLETIIDDTGNVLIRKPASTGKEKNPGVILQSHLDMVPQKNVDKKFNFDTDAIEAYIDGEWVKASGTTLGADNGIGVAAMLAILESTNITHGPMEALFTIDEETGMTGVFNLKLDLLKGQYLLNLDTEEEGELCVGCAGGINTSGKMLIKYEPTEKNVAAYEIKTNGLKGGHSGADIHLGRANANKILNRFLLLIPETCNLRLHSFNGGSLRNAIPREAVAIINISKGSEQIFMHTLNMFNETIKNEYAQSDPDVHITANLCDVPDKVISIHDQEKIEHIIHSLPNGPLRMLADMPDVVETSTNLAIVQTTDKDISFLSLSRSAVEHEKNNIASMIESIYKLAGAEVQHDGSYPGWKPDLSSPLLQNMKKIYASLYHKEPRIKVVHAGLECGIIGSAYPALQMVSLGPTILHPHSPSEKVYIPSVEKFWKYLLEVLKTL